MMIYFAKVSNEGRRGRRGHFLDSMSLVLFVSTVIVSISWLDTVAARYCPPRTVIKPCTCLDKNKGLDISCEGATPEMMREALENIAQIGQSAMYLKLTRNHMETFPPKLLAGLDVAHITAMYNNISFIHEAAFEGLGETLESLDLSQNSLTQVPSRALRVLTSLVSLNLNYNEIEVLPAAAFRGLISLLRLEMHGNKIKVIDGWAFHGIGGNLTRVNLGRNELTAIPTISLTNLTSLQRLRLNENRISSIRREAFKGVAAANSLDTLNLAGNHLTELPESAFAELTALNSLDLESNAISMLDVKAFHEIEDTLEWLKLGENKLNEVPSAALGGLKKLRQLDLRGNNITLIGRNALTDFGSSLRYVYLQRNRIQLIEPGALDRLTSIHWLYLQDNQLSAIPFEIFSGLLESLTVLDVHNNPFTCDCGIIWFREYAADKGANVVNQPMETRCAEPPSLAKKSLTEIPALELAGCVSGASGLFNVPKLQQRLVWAVSMVLMVTFTAGRSLSDR